MLTLQQLKELPPKAIIATGEVENSPIGIYMTDINIGHMLRWVAVRGGIHDWAIYIHWATNSEEWVRNYGDKIYNKQYIQQLVPCDDEAMEMYRF